ncbi:hypothetical protein RU639_005786 [Aspergillus parasiticus]
MDEDPRINGPFEILENFYLGMALHLQKQEERNGKHPWSSEWFARHLPQALKDHSSTFTHSDLLKQNIMVQELPQSDGYSGRQFEVTALLRLFKPHLEGF